MKIVALVAGALLGLLVFAVSNKPGAPASQTAENPPAWQVLAADAVIRLGIKSEWAEDVKMRRLAHDLKRAILPADMSTFVFHPPTVSERDAEPEKP